MAGLVPLPPSVVHSSTRLTHAQAHAHLSEFLDTAENNAAYRPDSTLTERGPQSASTGGNPNLTLHHLRRILQGIEGKRIGGEDIGRFFGEGARVSGGRKRKFEGEEHTNGKREQVGDQNTENDGSGLGIAVERERDDWQDKETYELAQDDDDVDMAGEERHPGAHLEEPADAEQAEEMAEIEIEDTGRKVGLSQQTAKKSTSDKEARKAAKKARAQGERRKKEDAKAKKAQGSS